MKCDLGGGGTGMMGGTVQMVYTNDIDHMEALMPVKTEDKMKSTDAKLFWNGRSQAVRLPKEFRFEGDRVRVTRVGAGVLLRPVIEARKETAEEWFARIDALKGDPIYPEGRNGSDLVAAMQASPDKETSLETERVNLSVGERLTLSFELSQAGWAKIGVVRDPSKPVDKTIQRFRRTENGELEPY